MILFLISFILVFLSSYFITSVIAPKKSILGLIYLFLIAFAQLVLTFEILSLFTAINEICVLIANVLFLTGSAIFWDKQSRPIWSLECKNFRNRVNNSLKLDKSLMWLYVGFCTFIISALILCLIMPITNADAQSYHFARSVFWVLQGSLNHFEVADIRNLCLPINSEILYSWVLLFAKKDVFVGFFSFVGYLMSIVSIYNILGYLGYCTRKKLWVIFILSSFASVIVQASGTETDIIVAGLVSSSICLFWYALKNNKMIPVFMAALAYALAIGTKTPAIIAIPGVGLFMLALCFYYKRFKQLAWFLGFGLINFLIFASFNYILNYIQFSNFMGPESFMVVSKNYFGIKGLYANFIKYFFMFFDFTGFRWSDYFGPSIVALRNGILDYLHLSYVHDGLYTATYKVNRMLLEPLMGAGVLGFLAFLPCVISGILKPIFEFKSKKTWFVFGFAALFVVNIMTLSYVLAYMAYNVRFVMFLIVLSSPILVYSYLSKKNLFKYIMILFAMFYLIGVSTHLWPRPLARIGKILVMDPSISHLRYRAMCEDYEKIPATSNSVCILVNEIKKNYSKDNKILVFMNTGETIAMLKELEFDGYKVDFRTMENVHNIDFPKYNMIITTMKGQASTLISAYERRKNDYKIVNGKVLLTKLELVPCIYVQNPILTRIKGEENSYPFQVRCGLSNEFFKRSTFKKITNIGIIDPEEIRRGEIDSFILYENTKLPLKRK